MTVNINLIVGGESAENASTADLIRRIDADVDAANSDPELQFALELVFQVAGPIWQPKALGPRLRRLATDGRSITAEIGVPEHFASELDMRSFLARAVREVVESVEGVIRKRGMDRSLVGIHQAVDRLLETVLGNGERPRNGTEGVLVPPESPIEEMLDERIAEGTAITLYRGQAEDMRYWEVWPDKDGIVFHEGTVGDCGLSSTTRLQGDATAADTIRAAVRRQLDAGFSALEVKDQATILLRYPAHYVSDTTPVDALWSEVESLVNNELGWRGLGRCVNVDYAGALTFTIVAVDSSAAIACIRDALGRAERLSMSTMTVLEHD